MPASPRSASSTRTVRLTRLHPAQARVRAEARRFNVVCCGRRFGKTVLGVNLAVETALRGYPVGWFAPQYKLLLEAWRACKSSLAEYARPNEQEKRLQLGNGGVIEFWAFDRNPSAGRGRKYKRIVVDEAAMAESLQESWPKAIRPTLTDFKGDAWFKSTPRGANYFRTLYELGQSDAEPEWMSWQMPTTANPHIDPAEVEAARRDMSAEEHRQEYGAEFLDTTGAVWFKRFEHARHVTEAAEYDPNLPVVLAVDSGVWTGAVLFQVTPLGTVRVFADYLSDEPGEANADRILALARERCGGRIDYGVSDPAGNSANEIRTESLLELYGERGLWLAPWYTHPGAVLDGLTLIGAKLDPADGATRLLVHPRCRWLIDAFQNYARRRVGGQWLDKPVDPQHPHEDVMDALRGGLYDLAHGPQPLMWV